MSGRKQSIMKVTAVKSRSYRETRLGSPYFKSQRYWSKINLNINYSLNFNAQAIAGEINNFLSSEFELK